MKKKFIVRKEGSDHIIEKHSIPRMEIKVDCNKPLPEIREIKVLGKSSPVAIYRGLEEVWQYLTKYIKK